MKGGLLEFIDTVDSVPSSQAFQGTPSLEALVRDRKRRRIISPRGSPLSPLEKKAAAEGIYHSLRYKYGFEEALRTGNWAPWPDECAMVTCYSQSVANYLLARSCGLNPILVEFVGLQQEGDTHRAGHSLVVVDVGEEGHHEPWIIDQPMAMYGPVTIDRSTMTVENLAARQERTHRRDYRTKTYGFLVNIVNGEEEIVDHIERLQANPEAILYPGQRIGVSRIDSWQSEEPLEAGWYLKFIPDQTGETKGDLVSRVILDRPGIKSRGLEFRITLGDDRAVKDERFFGYFCTGGVWADFIDPVPLVNLHPDEVSSLVKGLSEIDLMQHATFELQLMRESASPSPQQQERIRAAEASFRRVRESENGDIVLAMAAAEALYQHEKGSRDSYLTPAERKRAVARLQGTHNLIDYYGSARKYLDRTVKIKESLERRPDLVARASLLRPNQREDLRTEAFLALRTEKDRLEHILQHRPTYFDDAVDRLVFYDRRIKGKEDSVLDIARAAFGSTYDASLFSGYVRIFAEFLGHFAATLPQLSLYGYKQKIIKKITLAH